MGREEIRRDEDWEKYFPPPTLADRAMCVAYDHENYFFNYSESEYMKKCANCVIRAVSNDIERECRETQVGMMMALSVAIDGFKRTHTRDIKRTKMDTIEIFDKSIGAFA